jgi:hypothetical protein
MLSSFRKFGKRNSFSFFRSATVLEIAGYAVKTLESKETRALKKTTVTHNSVFAAHRLQCRMTIHKIDIRHFVFGAALEIRKAANREFGGTQTLMSAFEIRR